MTTPVGKCIAVFCSLYTVLSAAGCSDPAEFHGPTIVISSTADEHPNSAEQPVAADLSSATDKADLPAKEQAVPEESASAPRTSAGERNSGTVDDTEPPESEVLNRFLEKFDLIESQGRIRTLRAGSTGIGYTLETLLGIPENNSRGGDFMGMEIKAYRDDETDFDDTTKMNLFLKEPQWLDDYSTAERIAAFGYIDEDGRNAWYQSVTVNVNSTGLMLEPDPDESALWLSRNGRRIACWTIEVLHQRLQEKHRHCVFVAAASNGQGAAEEFHYRTVTYCARPDVSRLLQIAAEGDMIVELRMHVKPNGSARNHGTAFRVRKHRLRDLYAVRQRVRPVPNPNSGVTSE